MSARLRAGAVIGIGLLLALAATVGPLPRASGVPGASLTVELPGAVRMVVVTLFALSALILLSVQRRPRPTEEESPAVRTRRRVSAWVALLLPLPVLLLLVVLWHRRADGEPNPIETALSAIADLMEFLASARKTPTSLPLFDFTVATLLVLFALAVFGFMLTIALADHVAKWRSGGATAGAARPPDDAPVEDLGDLRAEPDPRRAIIRAWSRFERALAPTRAARASWQTPAEFMRAALARLPLPAPPVQRLTALFELARFSRRSLGTDTRDTACECLDEITAALEEDVTRGR